MLRRQKAYRRGFRKMKFPDIVHGNVLYNHLFFGVYLKKKFKIPFVVSEHWTSLQRENLPQTPFIVKKVAKIIGDFADEIMPVSEDLKISLQSLGISTPMTVIPNVVDSQLFKPKENSTSTDFRFIHVSSLIPRKQPEKIIQAVISLKEKGYRVSLEIGGSEICKNLQKLIHAKGAQKYISTFGEIPSHEVAQKMQKADAFLLFSIKENLPCVLVEALSAGIPFISTDVGGIRELKGKSNGILIRNNEQELQDAMQQMIEKKVVISGAEELRQFAVNHFSVNVVAKMFENVYKKYVKQS